MIKKLTLALGFGAGYVLGAKAGTERYEQIVAKARELAGQPAVQDITTNIQETAQAAGTKAKETVNEKVTAVNDKVSSAGSSSSSTSSEPDVVVVDLAAGAPIAGAAPSATAPDVI